LTPSLTTKSLPGQRLKLGLRTGADDGHCPSWALGFTCRRLLDVTASWPVSSVGWVSPGWGTRRGRPEPSYRTTASFPPPCPGRPWQGTGGDLGVMIVCTVPGYMSNGTVHASHCYGGGMGTMRMVSSSGSIEKLAQGRSGVSPWASIAQLPSPWSSAWALTWSIASLMATHSTDWK
jgi:hypothetical protein